MNDPRGSLWRKWDLHVHTPDSLVHNYTGPDPWDRFLSEIESLPPEFKVIGVNDYIFLTGYKRVLEERAKGRLANIDLFLPVIELRLDKFGGSAGHLSRVNCHVIFSNELKPELIEQQFLNALSSKYVLSPQYDDIRKSGKWAALPTPNSLEDLGKMIIESVPVKEREKFGSPLIEGFNNLCISFDTVREVLRSHYFEDKFITSVGKTEWAAIKWNDHSIAEKKTIINDADLVFISAESVDDWRKAKQHLSDSGVNDRLLDCSDAHWFSDANDKDRLGNCFTWIKADPTFQGLMQVLKELNGRVFVGDNPLALVQVKDNTTKYIKNIRIERKPDSTLGEVWFDNDIPFNPGMVAIIGNKGKGKSALTDILGLLCNTKQHGDFTFLSDDNFRQPKNNKAKHFRATLTWVSDTTVTKGLEEQVDETQPELVKYIPQNFLEKICTQLGRIEESDFDHELKKVIFSHVDISDQLNKGSFDDLITYMTSEATTKIQYLTVELHQINERIVALTDQCTDEHRLQLDNLLSQKQLEFDAHEKSLPTEVPKPDNDPVKQKEIAKVAETVESEKRQLAEYENNILLMKEEQARLTARISIANKLIERLDNLDRQVQVFIDESKDELNSIGVLQESILKYTIDKQPLLDKKNIFTDAKKKADQDIDPQVEGSLAQKKKLAETTISNLRTKLDEPNKKYQAYTSALKAWEKKRSEIIGAEDVTGTLSFYKKQIEELKSVPAKLNDVSEQRLAKAKEIHSVIRQLADTYRELYSPVNKFIDQRPLAKDKFQLNFEVGIVDSGFEESFFEHLSRGVTGSFCGVEEGHKMLEEILQRQDFDTESGIENFLKEIDDALCGDRRYGGKPVKVADQMRKGKSVLELYDTIFSLDYLKPRYSLRMGDKELSELSPGERGTLLLIFYLLVDKDDIPLVIDQPEENLDNQTVYELLVPCMKEAKERRQIVIVTHNPNLAVVCDAEQVICADLDKKGDYKMTYISGAIESQAINKAVVDILEGTMPAFVNRDSKYYKGTP
jgi:ABC-type lipoprotein export system ATPase subunit